MLDVRAGKCREEETKSGGEGAAEGMIGSHAGSVHSEGGGGGAREERREREEAEEDRGKEARNW